MNAVKDLVMYGVAIIMAFVLGALAMLLWFLRELQKKHPFESKPSKPERKWYGRYTKKHQIFARYDEKRHKYYDIAGEVEKTVNSWWSWKILEGDLSLGHGIVPTEEAAKTIIEEQISEWEEPE